jgi:hypothetical protein
MSTNQRIPAQLAAYRFPVLLALLTFLMVVAMEVGHPYFFFQDDNRALFLPFLMHNLRSLAGGELPLFNFHQSLGTPTSIQYASFYPVNYLALSLSKALFGNYFATMEIIAIIHLTIAALGFFYLMRSFRLAEVSCFFGAIAWTFCGFVITVGNSWVQVLGYAAYLPWILLFSIRQIYGVNPKGFFSLAALRIAALLVGNPQFFVYSATFDFLTVVTLYVTARRGAVDSATQEGHPQQPLTPTRFGVCYFGNYLVVIMATLPLLLQAMHQTSISVGRKSALSWYEYADLSYQMSHWLNGIFTPFRDMARNSWVEQHFISHVGYLTVFFLLLAVVRMRTSRNKRLIALFAVISIIALCWSADTIITKLFYYLPVYNRLRYPFKLDFFTSFYLVIVATFGFDSFWDSIKKAGYRAAVSATAILLTLHVGNFIVLYAVLPQHMFSRHLDKVPFDEPLKKVLADGRIVTGWLDPVFANDKVLPGFSVPTIGYDYATLWGVNYVGGYDTLMPEKNFKASLERINRGDFNVAPGHTLNFKEEVPLEHFRKWGVKWYLFEKSIPLTNLADLTVAYRDKDRNVLYDAQANSMVYWTDDGKGANIRSRFTTNSIEIETDRASGGTLIINVLHNPFFVAYVDGAKSAITETGDAQMALDITPGRHDILVKYSDRYFNYGLVVSGCFFLLLIAGTIVVKFMLTPKRRPEQQ